MRTNGLCSDLLVAERISHTERSSYQSNAISMALSRSARNQIDVGRSARRWRRCDWPSLREAMLSSLPKFALSVVLLTRPIAHRDTNTYDQQGYNRLMQPTKGRMIPGVPGT